jgi:hypothetical protein
VHGGGEQRDVDRATVHLFEVDVTGAGGLVIEGRKPCCRSGPVERHHTRRLLGGGGGAGRTSPPQIVPPAELQGSRIPRHRTCIHGDLLGG